jgi:hypothetical protein
MNHVDIAMAIGAAAFVIALLGVSQFLTRPRVFFGIATAVPLENEGDFALRVVVRHDPLVMVWRPSKLLYFDAWVTHGCFCDGDGRLFGPDTERSIDQAFFRWSELQASAAEATGDDDSAA